MVFMDLLSINGGVLCISQSDMQQLRKKCLADLLAGEIRTSPLCHYDCHAATKFYCFTFPLPAHVQYRLYVYMIPL